MEILGFPEVTLTLAVDRPNALVAVRLCDVAPDRRVDAGHARHAQPDAPREPRASHAAGAGARYTVTVRLNAIAHACQPGHRWRVAVSPTYWPWLWPSPEPVTLSIFTGAASYLSLPVRPPRSRGRDAPGLRACGIGAPSGREMLRPREPRRHGSRARWKQGASTLHVEMAEGYRVLASGRVYDSRERRHVHDRRRAAVVGRDCVRPHHHASRGATGPRAWRRTARCRRTPTQFHLTNAVDAYEGEVRVVAKTWSASIPRDLV